jgi:hypothetical protein
MKLQYPTLTPEEEQAFLEEGESPFKTWSIQEEKHAAFMASGGLYWAKKSNPYPIALTSEEGKREQEEWYSATNSEDLIFIERERTFIKVYEQELQKEEDDIKRHLNM